MDNILRGYHVPENAITYTEYYTEKGNNQSPFMTHFFNEKGEEIGYYNTDFDTTRIFKAPRVWHESIKAMYELRPLLVITREDYLEYFNNYLTIECFAEKHLGITDTLSLSAVHSAMFEARKNEQKEILNYRITRKL